MAKTKTSRYVAAEQQEEYSEAGNFSYPENQAVTYEAEGEPRCAVCGEVLAWHEEACSGVAPPADAEELPKAVVVAGRGASAFAYELGHQVRPVAGATPGVVTWRGQLKERHPATGMVLRVPVYRLDDGYWDCYREEELQAA